MAIRINIFMLCNGVQDEGLPDVHVLGVSNDYLFYYHDLECLHVKRSVTGVGVRL